jgi:hypothetical protein
MSGYKWDDERLSLAFRDDCIYLAVSLASAVLILTTGAVHIVHSLVYVLLPKGGYATNLLPLLANV